MLLLFLLVHGNRRRLVALCWLFLQLHTVPPLNCRLAPSYDDSRFNSLDYVHFQFNVMSHVLTLVESPLVKKMDQQKVFFGQLNKSINQSELKGQSSLHQVALGEATKILTQKGGFYK